MFAPFDKFISEIDQVLNLKNSFPIVLVNLIGKYWSSKDVQLIRSLFKQELQENDNLLMIFKHGLQNYSLHLQLCNGHILYDIIYNIKNQNLSLKHWNADVIYNEIEIFIGELYPNMIRYQSIT